MSFLKRTRNNGPGSGKERRDFARFLLLWLGSWISSIGSGLTAFGLGVYVFEATGSATSVSLVTLCAFLPPVVLGPAAGVMADRFDRRLLMLAGDGFSVFGLLYLLYLVQGGQPVLWQICTAVSFSSLFSSLTEPAYKASISDLLGDKQYARASGMVQLAAASKFLLSPALAGLLLHYGDIRLLLTLDISSLAVTASTVLLVRRSLQTAGTEARERSGSASFFAELKEGWQALSSAKGIPALLLVLTGLCFYAGLLETLYAPMLLPLTDARTLGIVESVSAAGLLAGSLIIGLVNPEGRHAKVIAAGLACSGVFFALLGVSTRIPVIAVAGFLFFMALPFVNTGAEVLIRRNVSNDKQGRIWGLAGLITQSGYLAAYASAGVLADKLFNPLLGTDGPLAGSIGSIIGTGPGRGIGLLFILCGLLIVLLAAVAGRLPSFRRLDQAVRPDIPQ